MIMRTNTWVEHVEMMNTVQFRIPSSVLSGHRRVFLSYQNRYRRDSPPCEKGTSCLLWVSQRGTSQLERETRENLVQVMPLHRWRIAHDSTLCAISWFCVPAQLMQLCRQRLNGIALFTASIKHKTTCVYRIIKECNSL